MKQGWIFCTLPAQKHVEFFFSRPGSSCPCAGNAEVSGMAVPILGILLPLCIPVPIPLLSGSLGSVLVSQGGASSIPRCAFFPGKALPEGQGRFKGNALNSLEQAWEFGEQNELIC